MTPGEIESKKKILLGCCGDAIMDLMFYSRKESEELTRDDLYMLINDKHITQSEITEALDKHLSEYF